jgi:hypothetical protein
MNIFCGVCSPDQKEYNGGVGIVRGGRKVAGLW